ncbi:hydrogenase nickel incorporation protein HypB [Desulfolithobacter sp.]
MCDSCGCHGGDETTGTVVDVHQSLLAANREQAARNRYHIEAMGAVAINMISSPGSGKTTLLEHTIMTLRDRLRIGVIEGDIETERDADRIRKKGVPVVQLTTGGACHLDAPLVHKGLHALEKQVDSGALDLIFIENVGNLVCPATFDLGEHERVILVSVPEGSDKPAKYPTTFTGADVFVITKTDLLPYFDFSVEEARREALRLKPGLQIFELAAPTGQGMAEWTAYLESLVAARR